MIQFNLLPDIKIEFMRTKRLKRIVIIVAIASSAVALLILLGMFSLNSAQRKHLGNLDKDITKTQSELEAIPDLDKILTVQKQLNTLPALYEGRPAAKRLPDYLRTTTPPDVNLSAITLDFTASTMSLAGKANSLPEINQYVDILKFTSFTVKGSDVRTTAFTNVVLGSYGTGEEPDFSITLSFAPQLFDEKQEITLFTPEGVTTRSQLELPGSDLFLGDTQTGEQ